MVSSWKLECVDDGSGKSLHDDIVSLGITSINELASKVPLDLYNQHIENTGAHVDR